jgi:hypothetical protein
MGIGRPLEKQILLQIFDRFSSAEMRRGTLVGLSVFPTEAPHLILGKVVVCPVSAGNFEGGHGTTLRSRNADLESKTVSQCVVVHHRSSLEILLKVIVGAQKNCQQFPAFGETAKGMIFLSGIGGRDRIDASLELRGSEKSFECLRSPTL